MTTRYRYNHCIYAHKESKNKTSLYLNCNHLVIIVVRAHLYDVQYNSADVRALEGTSIDAEYRQRIDCIKFQLKVSSKWSQTVRV